MQSSNCLVVISCGPISLVRQVLTRVFRENAIGFLEKMQVLTSVFRENAIGFLHKPINFSHSHQVEQRIYRTP